MQGLRVTAMPNRADFCVGGQACLLQGRALRFSSGADHSRERGGTTQALWGFFLNLPIGKMSHSISPG